MKTIIITIIIAMILMPILVLASEIDESNYCSGYEGRDDGNLYTTIILGGRNVDVYKINSNNDLCNYQDFCELKGMDWYAPQSPSEADEALTRIRDFDSYHTWIITMAPTVLGQQGQATWNGQVLTTIDSPECSEGSTIGFGAIRDWGCSMCNPEMYGTSRCWDSDHQYDWILCEGEYTPSNEIPEFGLLGVALVIAGAAGFLIFRRK